MNPPFTIGYIRVGTDPSRGPGPLESNFSYIFYIFIIVIICLIFIVRPLSKP